MDAQSDHVAVAVAYPEDRYAKGYHDGLCAALESVVNELRHRAASGPDAVDLIEALIEEDEDGTRQVLPRTRVLEGRDSLDCAYPDREGQV